ncbi:Zinc finger protein 853 [Frankliniella fusca]|uniref:Zinc finger protein 853 n=1 Tax=Frankliniella fusca TaxID=407009 RepID=A0AAE1GVA3_9NEOP|nr:Zinc finger protein 853 [Frankliniella fusca]
MNEREELTAQLWAALNFMGLRKKCSMDNVKKAYRTLAKIYHTDKGGDHMKIATLNNAMMLLRDNPDFLRQNDEDDHDFTATLKCHQYANKAKKKDLSSWHFQHHMSQENLSAKSVKHSGKRDFNCDYCFKKFGEHRDLVRHLRTHTGDKPFKCPDCVKTFSTWRNMMNHTKTHVGN